MPVTWIHFDASNGADTSTAPTAFAAFSAASAILAEFIPHFPCPEPNLTPHALLLREVTA